MSSARDVDNSNALFILAGLGNPGREFAHTRHNVGFMLIDRLAIRLNAEGMRFQTDALVSTARWGSRKILLAKPQTYMNLSGKAIRSLAHFYKAPLPNLLVAYDDLDLPFDIIRLRPGGGPGGQKGMASTIENLGSEEIARLRIGIGRPPGRMEPADYVLQGFADQEADQLPEVLGRAEEAALTFVREGIVAAMNRFNTGPNSS